MPADDDFLRELQATFAVEAREHLQTLSQGLMSLEAATTTAARAQVAESIFRAAHSLKGAARAVEMVDVEGVCQWLEEVLARLRREAVVLPVDGADLLHRALEAVGQMVDAPGRSVPGVLRLKDSLRSLATQAMPAADAVAAEAAPVPAAPVMAVAGATATSAWPAESTAAKTSTSAVLQPEPVMGAEGTVRVPLPRLEAQLLRTEELMSAKLAVRQRVSELDELRGWFAAWRQNWSTIEDDTRALRRGRDAAGDRTLARLIEFCEWGDEAVRALESRVSDITRAARHDHEFVNRTLASAVDGAKELLLLPFSTLSAAFPRLVRDLCRAEGKEADLVITGEQVALDKRILEEMKDPLVHMLRNAVDHAVETPARRLEQGKPRRASIQLTVAQLDGGRVEITLADDGAGISPERVRAAAVRSGELSEADAAALDDASAQALVFRSALSTGSEVTELSGRGLGLAIVQEHAQRLGGEVRLDSTPGQGTRFRIVVPTLRAAFRGVLCRLGERQFLMPAARVERVAQLRSEALRSMEGRLAVNLGDRVLPLVWLADVLELPATAHDEGAPLQVIVVGSGDEATAFVVDAVMDECEVVIKPLRKPLVRVRNIASAALLGSGVLVPVLHGNDLLRSARYAASGVIASGKPVPQPYKPPAPSAKLVVVAEDSITSRLLLKNLLQSAGYQVKTAVDGAEALALLRSERVDLLVSDVEMPRMNGFDLTARVRADRKLAELPVILVTALATREDKERGLDAGADAYIVKGSFDQDNLIATVERLIG